MVLAYYDGEDDETLSTCDLSTFGSFLDSNINQTSKSKSRGSLLDNLKRTNKTRTRENGMNTKFSENQKVNYEKICMNTTKSLDRIKKHIRTLSNVVKGAIESLKDEELDIYDDQAYILELKEIMEAELKYNKEVEKSAPKIISKKSSMISVDLSS